MFKNTKKSRIRNYLKALRVHQWAKNVLVFVPLVAAHKFLDLDLLAQAVTAFIAFSLCASSGYIFNDLLDLPFDRAHPRKRLRPIAAGEVSIFEAVALGLFLLLSSFAVGSLLAIGFLLVLGIYLGLVLAYSLTLRQQPLLDVFTLAVLYTLRHFAGAQATATPVSLWLLALSMFMFLSLALVKRCAELQLLEERQEPKARDREYVFSDFQYLQSMGLASGYVAVLVLALYVNSEAVVPLYSRPWLLWATCPLVLYWISRLWWKVARKEMHHDPLIFALTDKASLLTGALAGVIVLLAM
jgi:4-hydroxybenzoate polyprenyltransferase